MTSLHAKFDVSVALSPSLRTTVLRTTNSMKVAWLLSRDLFNFCKISDNISKTVHSLGRVLYRMVMLPMTLGDP